MTTASAGRVLAIGLDMADGALIRRWSRNGQLPTFARLMASGAWLDLDTTAEVLHTSTWPTFATGVMPGRHGVYYPYQPTPGRQLARHIGPGQYGAAPLWTAASQAGVRSVVFDIPETFPDSCFTGRAIFEWGTWAWYGEPDSQPATLLSELKSQVGGYPLGYEAKRLGLRWPADVEERLLASVRRKQEAVRWLLKRWDWDLALVGFCETHPAGHYLWPRGVDSASAEEDQLAALVRVYAAIDEAIDAILAIAPDVTVVVASGDGVRPNRCGWHLLPAVLKRLGYESAGGADAAGAAVPTGRSSLVSIARQLVPNAARQLVTDALPWRLRDRLGVWLQTRSIDWSRTRAFTLPTDLEGCIRINVRGREPFGIVAPGAEYTAVCHELRSDLEALVNPANGEAAVERVWLRDEVFPGPRGDELPDVIVTWRDRAEIRALASARLGTVEGVNPDLRPGTHSARGFALLSGPQVAGGQRRAHLVDLAPTMLALVGVRETGDLDGRALDLSGGEKSAGTGPAAPMELR